jgi:predicted esterase
VYDDHGALGVIVSSPTSSLAPNIGTYIYPEGPAANNGADIFRAAVGLDAGNTYWRVDWTTLIDRTVPIAMWAFDTDRSARTGISAWPAGAKVASPGVERALVVSSRGAWLLGATDRTDVTKAGGALHVDMAARSFVVRIPRKVLPVSGAWRVRLAAGLADRSGSAFAPVPLSRGARPGGPSVYNVAFRTLDQEPPLTGSGPAPDLRGVPVAQVVDGNLWNEAGQAAALSRGDVSGFFRDVRWADLAGRRSEREPMPTGYSVRWYVTRLNLGQGVIPSESGNPEGDIEPNYLSRVQPYAVFVPSTYRASRPAPLTWILHSLGVNHNQYGSTAPNLLQEACEKRGSICATILGFGPDGWYMREAEVNFWEVWHQLATHYRLDTGRTVISGYSMGGYGTYRLGLTYPDLFAKAMPLAAPPVCGARLIGPLTGAEADDPVCAQDGDTKPMVPNARWLPYVIGHGAADQLVPVTGVMEQARAFATAGYRYRLHLHPTGDHVLWSIEDWFSGEVAALGASRRTGDPDHITYAWYPDAADRALGLGPTGAYWLRGLRARHTEPGVMAEVEALTRARPYFAVTPERQTSVSTSLELAPAVVFSQVWRLGPRPAARPELKLRLVNVESLGVDMRRAGLLRGTVFVSTDGPAVLRLLGLPEGTQVAGGERTAFAGRSGVVTVRVPGGQTTLTVS